MNTIRKILWAATFLLLCKADVLSQDAKVRLFVGGGHSFNGSGDAGGYVFANQVDIKLSHRLYLSPGVQLTNHFGTRYIANYQFRNVTTGVNLYTNVNYLLLNARKHQIALGAGPVARFQRTSEPTTISYGATTPTSNVPRLEVAYDDPAYTLAVGYNVSPSYCFRLSSKLVLSARLSLQNDTRGDLIRSEMILLGVSL